MYPRFSLSKLLCVVAATSGVMFWEVMAADSTVYSNAKSYLGVVTTNGPTIVSGTESVTPMIFDDIVLLPGAGGQALTSVTFGVANTNTTGSVTATAYVRFFQDDGVNGGPGTHLGGLAVVTKAISPKTYQRFVVAPPTTVTLPLNGRVWVGVAFSNGNNATATPAQLALFGLPNFSPMTVGSSTTSYFISSAGGTYGYNNPAGSFVVAPSTPKPEGSFTLDLSVASLGPVNVTTADDSGVPGSFRYAVAQTSATVPIAFRNTANVVPITLVNGEIPLTSSPTAIQLPVGKDVTVSNGDGGGFISGSSGLSLSGPGQIRFIGANSYSGGTTLLSSASIGVGGNAPLGTGPVSVASSSKLFASGVTAVLSNPVTLSSGTLSVVDSPEGPKDLIFSGNISGAGGLELKQTGLVSLNGSNSFSGPLTLNSGTLTFSDSTALGNSNSSLALNGGSLRVTGISPVTLAGHTINGSSFNSRIEVTDSSGKLAIGSPLAGTSRIVKIGPGTLELAGVNSPGNGLTLSEGQISLASGAVISSTAPLQLDGGSLILSSTSSFLIGGLQGNGGQICNSNADPASSSAVVISLGNGGATATYAGVITDASGNFPIALEKVDSGIQTLQISQLYSGSTEVKGGVLELFGGAPDTSSVNVRNGSTLSLKGELGNVSTPVNVAGILRGFGSISGSLTNDGLLNIEGGSLAVSGAVINNGTIKVAAGSTLEANSATTFVNNGLLDALAGSANLPPSLVNGPNGVILSPDNLRVKNLSLDTENNIITVTIDGYDGHNYRLQKSSSLVAGDFIDVGNPQAGATGSVLSFTDPAAVDQTAFYRIAVE